MPWPDRGAIADPRRPRLAALACGLALWLLGCDPTGGAQRPAAGCTEAGAQCALPEGPLGVCERAPCSPGTTPPCFACTPQH